MMAFITYKRWWRGQNELCTKLRLCGNKWVYLVGLFCGMWVKCSTSDIHWGRNFSSKFTYWKGNFHLMEEMKMPILLQSRVERGNFTLGGYNVKKEFWVSKVQNVKDIKIFRKIWKAMEAWTSPALHNSTPVFNVSNGKQKNIFYLLFRFHGIRNCRS